MSLQAVASVLDGVKHGGSKGIGFPDFIDIMTRDSHDLAHDGYSASNSSATTAYNIALMARAYRCTSLYQVHADAHAQALVSLGHNSHCTKLCSLVNGTCKPLRIYSMLWKQCSGNDVSSLQGAHNLSMCLESYAVVCFRRKKVMEAVFKNEAGWRARFVQMHDQIQDQERRNRKK